MNFYVVVVDYKHQNGKWISEAKAAEYETGLVPPIRDAQIIVQPDEDFVWHTQSGYNHYVWREEQHRFVGVDNEGLWDYLLDTGLVIFGRTVTQKDFDKAMTLALEIMGNEKKIWKRDEKRLD